MDFSEFSRCDRKESRGETNRPARGGGRRGERGNEKRCAARARAFRAPATPSIVVVVALSP